jgi:hypothetical protein
MPVRRRESVTQIIEKVAEITGNCYITTTPREVSPRKETTRVPSLLHLRTAKCPVTRAYILMDNIF